jgi:carboxypeptidase C (cathepsin A)
MTYEYSRRALCALAAALLLAGAQVASAEDARGPGAANRAEQRRPDTPATPRTPLPPESVTTHAVDIGGQTLSFTARAGAVRLVDANSGAAQADIAYVAFERADAGDPAQRPVTFALNGGPGAASGFLDLGRWALGGCRCSAARSRRPLRR